MTSKGKKSWLRPQFTLGALLVLITLCAPFLAYLSMVRRRNDQRKTAFDDAVAKGIRLEPSHAAPNWGPVATKQSGARKLWSTLLGDSKLPDFARVQIHDFFGKNRPRPPITDADLKTLEFLPEIEDFYFYYSKDVTDEGLSVLGKLPKLKRITLNELTVVGGAFLDHFPDDCPLEDLTLVSLKGLDGQKLKSLGRFKNLRVLSIDGGDLLNDTSLREVNLSSSIKNLQLSRSAIGDETVLRWLTQLDLERLTLRSRVSRVSRAIVPGLARQTQLTVLELSNMPLMDEDFAFLKDYTRLASLQISSMPLRGQVLDYLAKPEQVTSLELSNTLFADDQVSKLSKFKALKILNLSWTPMTGETLGAEGDFLMPWSLSLSGTRFSDAGKDKLAKWKGLGSVTLPSNWTVEDDKRFAEGGAPRSPTYNAYVAPPASAGNGPPRQSYISTLGMGKIDNCPADLMKPVADLQALALAEQDEWNRKNEAKP